MGLLFLCFNGCTYVKQVDHHDPFLQLYKPLSVSEKKKASVAVEKKISFSANNMPLSVLCRILSDKCEIGIVYSNKVADQLITSEFKNSTLPEILTCLARQHNIDSVLIGHTYFLGSVKNEDRAFLVTKVDGFEIANLSKAINALMTDVGKSEVFPSGVIVVSDKSIVLQRIIAMLDQLQNTARTSWIVQMYFLVVRKDLLLQSGLDVSSSGSISYNIAESSLDFKDLKLDGLFNLTSNSSFADIYASPMFVLRDGVEGKWQDGETVPVPKKTVSNEGTVSTTGFDYIDTGVIVTCTVRESRVGAVLKLSCELSSISGYVEYAPIVRRSRVLIESEIQSNKLYLLGELAKYELVDSTGNVLTFMTDRGKGIVQLWLRAYRIDSNVEKVKPPKPSTLKESLKSIFESDK